MPDHCGTGFAYHYGTMVDHNAPAKTAKMCRQECEYLLSCKFWDFGEGFCRLRSDSGPKGKIADPFGYHFGTKNCIFGREVLCSR